MYLHLGQNVVVPEEAVIGIFDLDNTTGSHITRKFLGDAEKAGRVTSVSDELPKAFVVCSDSRAIWGKSSSYAPSGFPAARIASRHIPPGGKQDGGGAACEIKIYLSLLSSQTLAKRSGTILFDRKEE